MSRTTRCAPTASTTSDRHKPATGLERRPRPPFKLLNYGGSVGGPVWIPKIYDGRNKTFFLGSVEVTRVRNFTSTAFSRCRPRISSEAISPGSSTRPSPGIRSGSPS